MDRGAAQDWLDEYVQAWITYDPDRIAGLFSENIMYRYHPYDAPIVGRDAVAASWLSELEAGGASARDKPGTYEAEYSPIAVDGDTVVATGRSRYREEPDGPVVRAYENCFVMRFDDEGRCVEFTEYYLRRPQEQVQQDPAGSPSGDYGYDMAHEVADREASPTAAEVERLRDVQVATQTADSGQDYSYDLAHDIPRPPSE